MVPIVLPVVIAPVNENSMTQDVVILSNAVKNAVKKKVHTAEFSGNIDMLKTD